MALTVFHIIISSFFLFTLQIFGGIHSENFHRQRIHAFHVLQNEVREYVFLSVVAQRLDEGTFFLPQFVFDSRLIA